MKIIPLLLAIIVVLSACASPNTNVDSGSSASNSAAALINSSPPQYPEDLVKFEVKGWCDVMADIGPDGHPKNEEIVRCWPDGYFEAESLKVISNYRYTPAIENGSAVETVGKVERIRFYPSGKRTFTDRSAESHTSRFLDHMPRIIEDHIRQKKMEHIGMEPPVWVDAIPAIKTAPVYPFEAATQGIEGYCIVEFDLTEEGYTENHSISECNPSGAFDEYAISAVKQSLYIPALLDWSPTVSQGLKIKITFELTPPTAEPEDSLP